MVGLVWKMFWTFAFLRQSSAVTPNIKTKINTTRISQGILVGLTGCAITPTIDLTTLVETCIIGFFFSYCDKFF